MQEAIPGAIGFHVVEHNRALRSRVAQFALRELAFHASPYVGSTLSLQKLAAIDGRVLHNVLNAIARIAFEDVARLCLRGYNAPRALCVDASPRSVSQIFGGSQCQNLWARDPELLPCCTSATLAGRLLRDPALDV